MHIYNWYHSNVTGIPYIHEHRLRYTWRNPLANSLLLPFLTPLYLLGNPPSCDRIRPPWSPVACKLNSPFPSPCPYTPSSKIPTPRGFSHPNIHSLGQHCEPGSQDPAHQDFFPSRYFSIWPLHDFFNTMNNFFLTKDFFVSVIF
jgi:hypothetical protein